MSIEAKMKDEYRVLPLLLKGLFSWETCLNDVVNSDLTCLLASGGKLCVGYDSSLCVIHSSETNLYL